MTSKSIDRKGKVKGSAGAPSETEAALATFKLPESLPSSKVNFPVLIKRQTKASWRKIVEDSDKWHEELEKYQQNKVEIIRAPFQKTECDYIQNEVFIHLIPAVIKTLIKAQIWEAFVRPQCFFNGIDHLVQTLWNNNPRHPARKDENLHLFNMAWVRNELKIHPRKYYPKSWLWPEEYAATLIQKTVRRYLVQREDDVQEMRNFWRMHFSGNIYYNTKTSRYTERRNKTRRSTTDCDLNSILETFKLPESVSGSEIDLPVIIKPDPQASWKEIVQDSNKWHQELKKPDQTSNSLFLNTECDYIQREVFVHLIPALIETLDKAKTWGALAQQNCFFNGIDHIAQILWNNNPRHPERKDNKLHLFNMPWAREHLRKQ